MKSRHFSQKHNMSEVKGFETLVCGTPRFRTGESRGRKLDSKRSRVSPSMQPRPGYVCNSASRGQQTQI